MDRFPDYFPISVGTLRGDKKISFDVYIRVGEKFILYCREGDSFEGQRLRRLKEKNLKELFVTKDQEVPYRLYLEENVEIAYSSGKPLEVRVEIIQGYNQSLAESMIKDFKPEVYNEAKSSCRRLNQFLMEDQRALPLFIALENENKDIAHHGVTVSTLAIYLAHALGMAERPLELLALGCFIHDIGHEDSNVDFRQPIEDIPADQLKLYKKHPLIGAEKVAALEPLDALVRSIILQHEEHADASGFPKKLAADEMDPLVLVAGLANAFDRLITFEGLKPKEALKSLLIKKLGAYPLDHFQTLQDLLKSTSCV